MFPELLKLGSLTIRTYGFFVAVGFMAALQYLLWRGQKRGFKESEILDLSLYTIVGGLLGGRLMYVALNAGFYLKQPLKIFQIWEGGLVFYGGFVAGALVIIWYVRRVNKYFDFWGFADIMGPAVALAHVFGRIGCFFAGCCYGLPTSVPWAVTFKNPQALAPCNIPLHPTQLYESFGNLLIFLSLDWFNRFSHPKGQTLGAYLFLYGVLRFHVEFLRGDDRGGYLLWLSPSQLIAVVLICIGIYLIRYRKLNVQSKNNNG
jgi:phosphatidylglycerol:prolipoprotein diacylglycerol transferase